MKMLLTVFFAILIVAAPVKAEGVELGEPPVEEVVFYSPAERNPFPLETKVQAAFHADGSRVVTIYTNTGETWERRVSVEWNMLLTYSTPVEYVAAKAAAKVLKMAAGMSWGAKMKVAARGEKEARWDFKFQHDYYDMVSVERVTPKRTVKHTVSVGAIVKKSGKLKVYYEIDGVRCSRYAIQTLLMQQKTTVRVREFKAYAPRLDE